MSGRFDASAGDGGSALSGGLYTADELAIICADAYSPAGPSGSPSEMASQATMYKMAENVIGSCLQSPTPFVLWQGSAALSATALVAGLTFEANVIKEAYGAASAAFQEWSDTLLRAQQLDTAAATDLRDMHSRLIPYLGMDPPRMVSQQTSEKILGYCLDRRNAVQMVEKSAASVSATLTQFAELAWAQKMVGPNCDPLAAIETVATAFGTSDIINPEVLGRAAQHLAQMSSAEQAQFDAMLAGCKSTVQQAYLWKALSANYSIDQIKAFDDEIQPHGDDLQWLNDHLSPDIATGGEALYDGETFPGIGADKGDYNQDIYSQGKTGDCVAASTVIARANIDPIYMLGLTTGYGTSSNANGSPQVGDDSSQAFHTRLQQAYLGNFDPSVTPYHPEIPAHSLLSHATGSNYEVLSTQNAAARQAALPQIESAVDAGKPVAIGVNSTVPNTMAHQVIIIGRAGPNLEIYNPYGYSAWVTEQQFVDGQLGAATGESPTGGLPVATGIVVPES